MSALPPAAITRLGELLPVSWDMAKMQPVIDWAEALVAAARAEERARAEASGPKAPRAPAEAAAPGPATERGGRWSEAERASLIRMAGEGATAKAIAEVLGRPAGSVAFKLTRMRQQGEIAPAPPPKGEHWTDDDCRALLALLAEGRSNSDIAELLGRTVLAVKERIGRLRRRGAAIPAGTARATSPHASRKIAGRGISSPVARPKGGRASGDASRAIVVPPPACPGRQPALRQGAGAFGGSAPQLGPVPATAEHHSALPSGEKKRHAPAAADLNDDAPDGAALAAALAPWAARIAADISAPPRPIVQRAMAHLDRLSPDPRFDPVADLRLLVEVCAGRPSVEVAADLGVSAAELGQRFRAMLRAELRGLDGRLSIAGRLVLLEAAKRNAVAP